MFFILLHVYGILCSYFLTNVVLFSAVSAAFVCVQPPCLRSLLIFPVVMSSAEDAGKGEGVFFRDFDSVL